MARPLPPVCILGGQIAALALARRVGPAAPVAIADRDDAPAIAWASRYCHMPVRLPAAAPGEWISRLLAAARQLAAPPVLLATSDEWLQWTSRWRGELAGGFRLRLAPAGLLTDLLDKRRMPELAAAHGVGVPRQMVIHQAADLAEAARRIGFPCLLKSADSHPGGQAADDGKLCVHGPAALAAAYARLAALDTRVLVQEYLPGGCDRVALFNAYFAAGGVPLAALTGRKLLQYPLDYGTACLSECAPAPGLAPPLTRLFSELGYAGPVDVGLKYDVRSQQFKILDINPRLGQNYANFRTTAGEDVGWLAYADAAGLLPPERYRRCLGGGRRARWAIEDDLWRAWRLARAAGRPGPSLWTALAIRQFAFWSWRDPGPLLRRLAGPVRRRLWRPGFAQVPPPRTTSRHAASTNSL